MPNFFFNTKSKKIEQCDDGCQRCVSTKQCSICSDFYYAKGEIEDKANGKDGQKKDDSEDKKSLDMGKIMNEVSTHQKSLNCVSCNIPDCKFCKEVPDQIKKTTFVKCSLCNKSFALVDEECKACPKNCEYCRPQSLECLHCSPGFQWNKKKSICKKITVENCSYMKKKKCVSCDNLFYLDATNNKCNPCKTTLPNCEHCTKTVGEPKCRFCERGYYVVQEEDDDSEIPKKKKKKKRKKNLKPGTCAKCSENCSHCGEERCYICKEGFFYNEKKKKCLKCKIEKCDYCLSSKICENCQAGYRFNKKTSKCERCAGGCLRCSDKGHCYECPVDHFVMIQEKIKRKKGQNILNNLLGMFLGSVGMNLPSMPVTTIEFKTDCLKECPKKVNGKEVIVNFAQRRCVVKTTEQTQQIPVVSLPNLSQTGSFYLEVEKLKLHYLQEIRKIKTASLKKKISSDVKVSEECFNNGLIRKIYRGNLSSYYICRCLPGLLGDNCQITEELHQAVQQKLLVLLDNIHQRVPGMPKQRYKEVLNTLIEFNKFKIDETVVTKVMETLAFFLDRNHSVENQKRLYILYDSMLLSVFDLLEDIHKSSNNQLMVNYDAEQEEIVLREKVKKLVMLIEASFEDVDYAHSFLSESSKEYVGLQTFSFIISEFRLTKNKFQTANPNIDSSFNTEDVTKLELIAQDPEKSINKDFNAQLINFSVELFQPEFQEYEMLTNVLYIKFLDSLNPHIRVVNKSLKLSALRLEIPLLTLPGFVDIVNHIFCLGFRSGGYTLGSIQGVVEGFDEDTRYVTCLFENLDAFTNTYFGVFIKKRDDKD
jgi:hypothetical protein